jgi:hypothetical protein
MLSNGQVERVVVPMVLSCISLRPRLLLLLLRKHPIKVLFKIIAKLINAILRFIDKEIS